MRRAVLTKGMKRMKLTELEAAVEAILFMAGEAVSVKRLASSIGTDTKTAKSIVLSLTDKYEYEKRGISILEINDSFQMCTNKDLYKYVENFCMTPQKKALTQSLMETLAIIAYKQPVMKSQIEEIRGVNADHSVNKLVEYGLVTEKGRSDAPGRPILFGTTDEFLKAFGFKSLSQLPLLNGDVLNLKVEEELIL